ncbi:MAG: hypothetical protein ABIJ14_01755, partial [Nanoarchaeota archaeon]
SQHMGLGKWLMDEAEKICRRENGRRSAYTQPSRCRARVQDPKLRNEGAKINELKIISGVGVREYYRKLGYGLEKGKGKCMVKKLQF